MLGFEADRPSLGTLAAFSEKLSDCRQNGLAGNDDPGAFDLFVSLRVVADVGEKGAAGRLDQQKSSTAAEPAKVSDVRKMADEESIEARGRKMLAKFVLASAKVHWRECSSRSELGATSSELRETSYDSQARSSSLAA